MSFKIEMSRIDRLSGRFLGQVNARLANASVSAKKERGLILREVAEELGMDKGQLSKILTGKGNPTIRMIGRICAVLGYKPEFVLHKISDHKSLSNSTQDTFTSRPAEKVTLTTWGQTGTHLEGSTKNANIPENIGWTS